MTDFVRRIRKAHNGNLVEHGWRCGAGKPDDSCSIGHAQPALHCGLVGCRHANSPLGSRPFFSCARLWGWAKGARMKCLNMIGPQVRRLRYQRGWSQEKLAEKLQLLGWDISRAGLGKIESRLVHVEEYELLYFARAFNVRLDDLFPPIDTGRQIHEVVAELMRRKPQRGDGPTKALALGLVARAPRRWSG